MWFCAVLAGWCLILGVALLVTGSIVAGALALALAAWILYATLLGAQLNDAVTDRDIVVSAWRRYSESGLSPLERARADWVLHAPNFPCGVDHGIWVTGASVNCPLCVSLTAAES